MKKISYLLMMCFISVLCFYCCSNKESLQEKFNSFENKDFSDFNDMSITWRYTRYIVQYNNGMYIVETNYSTNNISMIKQIQNGNNIKVQLSEEDINKIQKAIKIFYNYKFQTCSVDKQKNISLSFLWGENCTYYFLKLSPSNTLKDMQKQYYQHYKDNWYFDKSCAEIR